MHQKTAVQTFHLHLCYEWTPPFQEKAEESRGKTERVLVLPYDARIPKIRIGTRQADLLRSHRIVVQIDTWSSSSQYPDGHFVRSIGPIGDVETETAVIMIEHDLSFPSFSRDLLNGQSLLHATCPLENSCKMCLDEASLSLLLSSISDQL